DQEMSYNNPWARLASSFQESKESMMQIQLEMEHRFTGKLEGFTAWGLYNAQRKTYYSHTRSSLPFYYALANTIDGSYRLLALNPDSGTEYLDYRGGGRTSEATQYGEVRLTYNKTLNDVHSLDGALIGTIRDATGTFNFNEDVADQLTLALPRRNISTAGRIAYGYDSRHVAQHAYGLNGRGRLAQDNRGGFFPTAAVRWSVSNEKFWSGLADKITTLSLRGPYGEVGTDAIGAAGDRFFYLSHINMNPQAT